MRVWLVGLCLLLVPMADALDIGTRTVKARESDEYSPNTVYDHGVYGCGVTVAIFDEGVDDKHPHLDGKVIAGVDTTDTGTFWTLANGGNPQPVTGTHGTPVAALAVSHAGDPFFASEDRPMWADDDLVGMAPCAWMVDVMFNDITGASEAEMLAGFQWAIDNKDNDWGDSDPSNDGIDIITMSWSPNDYTDGTDPICEIANEASRQGIVVLGSAGNSGSAARNTLGCPTGADLSISVANLYNERTVDRSDDHLQPSSSWGPRTDDGDENPYDEMQPDVATPGHAVVGAIASNDDGTMYTVVGCGDDSTVGDDPSGTVKCSAPFSGTSAATPMTAGVVALLLETNGNLTPMDIKEIIHQAAVPHPDAPPRYPELNAKYNETYGYGMMDAYAAMVLAKSWPGMELGADTDSDGVRDHLDTEPYNPEVTKLRTSTAAAPAGGNADSDGDGVVDAEDGAPLDPQSVSTGTQTTDGSNDSPAVSLLVVMLGLLVLARRK